jgi:hypothetical protein
MSPPNAIQHFPVGLGLEPLFQEILWESFPMAALWKTKIVYKALKVSYSPSTLIRIQCPAGRKDHRSDLY